MTQLSKSQIIERLAMMPHPEGGYWCRSHIANAPTGERAAWSAIYYLLADTDFSALHSLDADELWHFHSGGSLTIVIIYPDATLKSHTLGTNIAAGEQPQVLAPAGSIFGAWRNSTSGVSLVGCTVIPAYDHTKFRQHTRTELLEKFPQHADYIVQLTR